MARYRTAAGSAQLLPYFYPLLGQVEAGLGYQDFLGALRDIGADNPEAFPNATIQDRQALWGQINDQLNANTALAAADLTAPLDRSMWSWAPGHQLSAVSDLFESYQVRVQLTTDTMDPDETLTRTVTLDGPLDGYTVEGLLAAVRDVLQQQLDDGDTPPEGGWGPTGPGTVLDMSDISIMRL